MSNVAERTNTIEIDAVVIGSGFAGLYSVHKLRNELGLSVQGLDNAADVGGTWYWNRYPGARSDTEVHVYCYFFDQGLHESWKWSERYPRHSEIRAYLNHVADRYNLRRSYQFSTQVESAVWDEETNRWQVSTDRGQTFAARFLVEAVGLLSATNIPEFKGQEHFMGDIYHTARWPHEDVDLSGKRVAVIGTGSSGIQVISEIAPKVDHLTVFQRTPQWVVPSKHRPIDPALMKRIHDDYEGYLHSVIYSTTSFGFEESQISAEEVSEEERLKRFEDVYNDGGGFQYMFRAFNDVGTSLVANKAATDVIEKKIREAVTDPVIADKLVPTQLYARRPLCCDNYYESYNRDNVTLIDVQNNPITEFTENGVKLGDTEYEVDVIVLATGFDAVSGNQLRIHHEGRDGLQLRDKWKERTKSYLGMTINGFPNLFMVYGPMGPFTNQPPVHEFQVDWIADAITHTLDSGMSTIEPTAEAEEEWMEACDTGAAATLFPRVASWINGANVPGKPVTNYFFMGGMAAYAERTEAEKESRFSENFRVEGKKPAAV